MPAQYKEDKAWELQPTMSGYLESMPEGKREKFTQMLEVSDPALRPYNMALDMKLGLPDGVEGGIVLEHRGSKRGAHVDEGKIKLSGIPENTSDALMRSWKRGGCGAELDIQLAKGPDGKMVPVGFHDPKIANRMILPNEGTLQLQEGEIYDPGQYTRETVPKDSRNRKIEDCTIAELQEGVLRDPTGRPTAYRIETLGEVFDKLQAEGVVMPITLDIKNPAAAKAAWEEVAKRTDCNGVPLAATVAIKIPAKNYPMANDVKEAFNSTLVDQSRKVGSPRPDWEHLSLMPVYGTGDLTGQGVFAPKNAPEASEEDNLATARKAMLESMKDLSKQPFCQSIEIGIKAEGSQMERVRDEFLKERPGYPIAAYHQPAEIGPDAPSLFNTPSSSRSPSPEAGQRGEEDLRRQVEGLPRDRGRINKKVSAGELKVVFGEGHIEDVSKQFMTALDGRPRDDGSPAKDQRNDFGLISGWARVITTDDPKGLKAHAPDKWNDAIGTTNEEFSRLRALFGVDRKHQLDAAPQSPQHRSEHKRKEHPSPPGSGLDSPPRSPPRKMGLR